VVVTVGLLGRREDDLLGVVEGTPGPAPSQLVAPASTAPPEAPDTGDREAERVSFPAAIDGLPVRYVSATLAAHAQGTLSGIVAVAGYLSITDIPPACADRISGPFGALCQRFGLVADGRSSPWIRPAGPRLGPHLHPEFPPGVRIPPQLGQTMVLAAGPPLPVVLLGRFGDRRTAPCERMARDCRGAFVVLGVAWYDGETWRRPPALEPTLDLDLGDASWPGRQAIARAALGDVDRVLVMALVGPATLARIDPGAAAALPEPAPDPVWYVLGLEVAPGPGSGEPHGTTRWVLVDDASGAVVAAGGDRGAADDPTDPPE
jgi:hypothetical protein